MIRGYRKSAKKYYTVTDEHFELKVFSKSTSDSTLKLRSPVMTDIATDQIEVGLISIFMLEFSSIFESGMVNSMQEMKVPSLF